MESPKKHLNVISLANGHAGRYLGCEHAIKVIKQSKFLAECRVPIEWKAEIEEKVTGRHEHQLEGVIENSKRLSIEVSNILRQDSASKDLLVLGGDHSCAIGTWSGVSFAMRDYGDVGLIWIDGHMLRTSRQD